MNSTFLKIRWLLFLFPVFLLTACTATYQQMDVTDKPNVRLDPNGKVLVATPRDGRYATQRYSRSGDMTARAIKSAFARQTNYVEITQTCLTLKQCIPNAKAERFDYLVIPEILHWEERATEWSGKPDRIEVKISLYEIPNGKGIHSTIISGKSKWATFGGDHPQDLLPDPINKYVSTLY